MRSDDGGRVWDGTGLAAGNRSDRQSSAEEPRDKKKEGKNKEQRAEIKVVEWDCHEQMGQTSQPEAGNARGARAGILIPHSSFLHSSSSSGTDSAAHDFIAFDASFCLYTSRSFVLRQSRCRNLESGKSWSISGSLVRSIQI